MNFPSLHLETVLNFIQVALVVPLDRESLWPRIPDNIEHVSSVQTVQTDKLDFVRYYKFLSIETD